MDQIKTIAGLCAVIDQQNAIIRDQATELALLGADPQEDRIAAARAAYVEAMGEEAPT